MVSQQAPPMSLFGGPTAAAVPQAAPAAPGATVPASASPLPGTAPKETTPDADGGPRKVTSTVTVNHAYYFDPRGDLTLEVGPHNVSYVVCSRSISRASPVFAKMLFGGFTESKPEADGKWRIQLPEDDPVAMRLLLNIMHGRFAEVQAPATEKLLFDVTVLTDKYSLTHILRPWAQGWLSLCNGVIRADPSSRIWIAWELGAKNIFAAEYDNLLITSRSAPMGVGCGGASLVDSTSGKPLNSYVMLGALDVLDSLAKARVELLRSLLAPVHKLWASLLGRGQPIQPKCVVRSPSLPSESEQCEAVILGTLVKALAAFNLDGLSDAASYAGSASGLYNLLKALQYRIQPLRTASPGALFASDHTRCNPAPELMADIDKAYSSRRWLVTDTHWAHMNAQASKTGVSNTKFSTTSIGQILNSTPPIFGFPVPLRDYSQGFPAP